MKAAAYWVAGSVALYSDALETVIDVVAAGGALAALWFAEQPTDANHPHGHKAEYLSAVVEGALVLVTALIIRHEAWLGWQNPHAPETPFLSIGPQRRGGSYQSRLSAGAGLQRAGLEVPGPGRGREARDDGRSGHRGGAGGLRPGALDRMAPPRPACGGARRAEHPLGGYGMLRESWVD